MNIDKVWVDEADRLPLQSLREYGKKLKLDAFADYKHNPVKQEAVAKLTSDMDILDSLNVGDNVMTHDGKRWSIAVEEDTGQRVLIPDNRNRAQRRRDSKKARR